MKIIETRQFSLAKMLRYLLRQSNVRSDIRTSKTLLESVPPTHIIKRNGTVVDYDPNKFALILKKAFVNEEVPESVLTKIHFLNRCFENLTVENSQDNVQVALMLEGYFDIANKYSNYRHTKSGLRTHRPIPEDYRQLMNESRKYFSNIMGMAVCLKTYCRFLDALDRRETVPEMLSRYLKQMKSILPANSISEKRWKKIEAHLFTHVMPSMRALQFSGPAIEKENVHAYNCSYTPIDRVEAFSNLLYISMCGTGAAFSVENKYISQLPTVQSHRDEGLYTILVIVEDSREGWKQALDRAIDFMYAGYHVDLNVLKVRPKGAPLMTTGGTASGPEPLVRLVKFIGETMKKAAGRQLTDLEVHDIACYVGDIVQLGGVRRSAMLSLSDLHSEAMRNAKSGDWYVTAPYRSIANNSAVYVTKPSVEELLFELKAMHASNSGERGIFNRDVECLKKRLAFRGLTKSQLENLGTNPCGEIILQPNQFCNLTKIIARPEDTLEDLIEYQKTSAILGTYQSYLINFPFLSEEYRQTTASERLLGCSISGILACELVRQPENLMLLRETARNTNRKYAKKFDIPSSSAITCVKPDGNSSAVDGSTSGISPAWSKYYIRHVRFDSADPIATVLADAGWPRGKTAFEQGRSIFCFPCKSSDSAIVRSELSAMEHLQIWLMYQKYYCDHNTSCTIYYDEAELPSIAEFLVENWEHVGGLAFLNRDSRDTVYEGSLMPFQEITREEYEEMVASLPPIDLSKIYYYEKREFSDPRLTEACAGDLCLRSS